MSSVPNDRDTWTFQNSKGLKIQCYQEKPLPTRVERSVLLVHGLQSHYEFEWCAALEDAEKENHVKTNSPLSWARQLHGIPGCAVYGIDIQGHGCSDSWNDTRTNVEAFDDYVYDIIQALKLIAERQGTHVPICLIGISLGGAIVSRTIEVIGKDNIDLPYLKTAILLAPAVSIEKLKAKPLNRLALPLAPLISAITPKLKAAGVELHPIYPEFDRFKKNDPKSGQGKIPARLANETVKICPTVMRDAHYIGHNNPALRVHIIHSEADGFVDPQGSKDLFNKMVIQNKALTMLNENTGMWHYLTLEPNTRNHVLPVAMDEVNRMS